VDPTGQADGRADVGGAQLGAIMRSVGVHSLSLGSGGAFPSPPLLSTRRPRYGPWQHEDSPVDQ
jgi:hypothetical protein